MDVNGHPLPLNDFSVGNPSRTHWGAGVQWFLAGQSQSIIPSSGSVGLAVAEDISQAFDRIETAVDNIRQAPATPADPTRKWHRGDQHLAEPTGSRTGIPPYPLSAERGAGHS